MKNAIVREHYWFLKQFRCSFDSYKTHESPSRRSYWQTSARILAGRSTGLIVPLIRALPWLVETALSLLSASLLGVRGLVLGVGFFLWGLVSSNPTPWLSRRFAATFPKMPCTNPERKPPT